MNNDRSEESSQPSRRWYAFIIAGAIICSSVIAFFVKGGMSKLQRLEKRKEFLKKEKQRLSKKSKALELRRKRLHQDPQLIEEIARNRLGMTRPGEKKIKFETFNDTSSKSSGDTVTMNDNASDTKSHFQQEIIGDSITSSE